MAKSAWTKATSVIPCILEKIKQNKQPWRWFVEQILRDWIAMRQNQVIYCLGSKYRELFHEKKIRDQEVELLQPEDQSILKADFWEVPMASAKLNPVLLNSGSFSELLRVKWTKPTLSMIYVYRCLKTLFAMLSKHFHFDNEAKSQSNTTFDICLPTQGQCRACVPSERGIQISNLL